MRTLYRPKLILMLGMLLLLGASGANPDCNPSVEPAVPDGGSAPTASPGSTTPSGIFGQQIFGSNICTCWHALCSAYANSNADLSGQTVFCDVGPYEHPTDPPYCVHDNAPGALAANQINEPAFCAEVGAPNPLDFTMPARWWSAAVQDSTVPAAAWTWNVSVSEGALVWQAGASQAGEAQVQIHPGAPYPCGKGSDDVCWDDVQIPLGEGPWAYIRAKTVWISDGAMGAFLDPSSVFDAALEGWVIEVGGMSKADAADAVKAATVRYPGEVEIPPPFEVTRAHLPAVVAVGTLQAAP